MRAHRKIVLLKKHIHVMKASNSCLSTDNPRKITDIERDFEIVGREGGGTSLLLLLTVKWASPAVQRPYTILEQESKNIQQPKATNRILNQLIARIMHWT